eukprot:CAMPEP_0119116392 /NCGR_PEP_ID=MMETSP1180-20130426/52250_1 /TAXON_ID=3052 ORGANISM="Chlamydomonas cf sp, Strain CCMP681" /NCGR_SAMPLE_ID=MMETSP1180 /ASSEMBLY_ACC=CAM_ASM_000741 /LENGTH=217 /DNA_ID=CAMNT_0007105529 /DNA_START=18 /DNA_END=671 /DNA_ORIENTATION=+
MSALLARNKLSCGQVAVSRPAAPRALRMVVRAQAQPQRPSLASMAELAKPAAAAVTAVVANVIMAMPAAAADGKLFDFNLTLPVMAGQFLLLMVFLDKFWFTPVGKVLDERDAGIRNMLGSVKDNSGDVDKFAVEAQEILKVARSEVTALINSQKGAKQAELDKQYNTAKLAITAEVETSIAALEKESQAMFQKLDAQVDKVASEVLKRVLPPGLRI